MLLKRIINKLRSLIRRRNKQAGNEANISFNASVDRYIKSGNIRVGQNCDLSQLSVVIYGSREGEPNIVIGDDCYLMGGIVLHQYGSRVAIGDRVFIGPNTTFFCYDKVEISDDVMISWGCTLIDTNAHSLKSAQRANDVIDWKKGWQYKDWSNVESKPILIGKKSWVGFNSIITKGVSLAEGTVVACGSVVTKNSDAFTVIGGNPATFIKATT